MEISVPPTDATSLRPKPPRKMSPIPQIAKLTSRNPITTAITALPIRPEDALWMFLSIASSLNLLQFRTMWGAPAFYAAISAAATKLASPNLQQAPAGVQRHALLTGEARGTS